MYGDTLLTQGSLSIDGDVGVTQGAVTFSADVQTIDILDTSVMPQTVLERRPILVGGELRCSLAEFSTGNAALFGKLAAQTAVTVSFSGVQASGGGSVSISMSGTVTAAEAKFDGDTWALIDVTIRSIGAVSVSGMA